MKTLNLSLWSGVIFLMNSFLLGSCTAPASEKAELTAETITDAIVSNEPEKVVTGVFHSPRFCGDKLIYTNAGGNQLSVLNIKTKESEILLTQKEPIKDFDWNDGCQSITYSHKNDQYKIIFKSFNVVTGEHSEWNGNSNISATQAVFGDTIYYLDNNSAQIMVQYKGQTRSISNDDKEYYNLLVSPDKQSIVVNSGADIVIFDAETGKSVNAGNGIPRAWSPDGHYLVGTKETSLDGHDIADMDLFLLDVETLSTKNITNTSHQIEDNPVFLDHQTILYTMEGGKDLYEIALE